MAETKKRVRCVWHEEKTPSLCLDLARGVFHCFGCGRRGPLAEYEAARAEREAADGRR